MFYEYICNQEFDILVILRTVKKSQIDTVTNSRHFVQSNTYVYLMICCSWLVPLILVAPMFSPTMAPNAFWMNFSCLPPNSFDDLPWILVFWFFGFVLTFIPLIVMPILIMVKRCKRFEADRRRYEEKVRTSQSIMLRGVK